MNQAERQALIDQEEFGNRYLKLLQYRQAIDSPSEEEASAGDQNQELKSQVVYLAIEAFRREEISKGKLLDLSKKLQISGKDFVALAQGAL